MSYRIAPGEPLPDALHRIGEEQFSRALKSLRTADEVGAVHETRKCIKRLRALLRLVRSGIGERDFRRENERLRDIARSLSGARDQAVLSAMLAGLAAAHQPFRKHHRRLSGVLALPAGGEAQPTDRQIITLAVRELKEAREAWPRLAPGEDLAVLAEGLERGLRALGEASVDAANGEAEAVHDWRKAVQRHWRHMRLMGAGWPDYFATRQAEARGVSELLGRSQDLSLLASWLEGPANAALKAGELQVLHELIADEQRIVRGEAGLRTARLTAERPGAHARNALAWLGQAALAPRVEVDQDSVAAAAHRVEGAPRKRVRPNSAKVAGRKPRPPRSKR